MRFEMTMEELPKVRRKTLTVPEAAEALGVSRQQAYDAAKTGEIPTIKVGKRILVPVAAFNKLLEGVKQSQS
jgi:excisionase family DNA binding protein